MSSGSHRVQMRSPFLLGGWPKIALALIMLLLVGFSELGCAGEQGSGNITSETRDVSGFSEVALNGVGNLTIRQRDSESLTIKAEENIIPELTTEVRNNRLTIEPGTNIRPTQPINYELTVKDLSALELLGAGGIDASNIDTDNLRVAISGAGNLTIAGEANSQDIDVSGAGSYLAANLESEEAEIDLSGVGDAIVNVSNNLDVRIDGLGSVEYIGKPYH